MKNTITTEGAELLKALAECIDLGEPVKKTIEIILDGMTGATVMRENHYEIMKKNVEKIKRQKEEIERLRKGYKNISIADFTLIEMPGENKYYIIHDGNRKLISDGDMWNAIKDLFFRAEEKRSCATCVFETNGQCFHKYGDDCVISGKHSEWQPKQS